MIHESPPPPADDVTRALNMALDAITDAKIDRMLGRDWRGDVDDAIEALRKALEHT